MKRKFNREGGLLSLEDSTIVESNEIGLDVPDDQLFVDPVAQELPAEAADVLVYFTAEKAKELTDAGPELTMESFWELISDIESIRASVRSEGGVSQSLALECERLMPGFLNDDYPVKAFSKIPTRTNLSYTVEAFDIKSAAIIGGIIAIILGIAKLMFGGGSSSSGSGGGGGGGAAEKVEANLAKTVEVVDAVVKAILAMTQGGQITPEMVKSAASGNITVEGVVSGSALEGKVKLLNEHFKQGLTELETFALGENGIGKAGAMKEFWSTLGKGNYSDAVITINHCLEDLDKTLKDNIPEANQTVEISVQQNRNISASMLRSYSKLKVLPLFSSLNIDPSALAASPEAMEKFFASSPATAYLSEMTKLKNVYVTDGYAELIKKMIEPSYLSAQTFFEDDFKATIMDVERRKEAHQAMGTNATSAMTQLEAAFGKATDKNIATVSADASNTSATTVKLALKLCEFLLKIVRDLAHIFNNIALAIMSATKRIKEDISIMLEITNHEAKLKAPKPP